MGYNDWFYKGWQHERTLHYILLFILLATVKHRLTEKLGSHLFSVKKVFTRKSSFGTIIIITTRTYHEHNNNKNNIKKI